MNAPTDSLDAAIEAELPPAERRWLEWLKWAGEALVGIYVVIAIGMVALRYWVLPHVADYKTEIAAAVSRAVGERVEVATISAQWSGLHPQLELAGVKLVDQDGRETLALPYVGISVSWRSLLAGKLLFRTLVLDRPALVIRRDAQGRLFVAGLESKPEASRDGNAADWVLGHGEIVIRDATVEWDDESRLAVPLRLERVAFVLQNGGRHHRFALRAEPPAELGSPLDIRGDLVGRTVAQLREWNGRLYAAFDYIDLAAWRTWVDYPFEVGDGRGALRLWLGFGDGALTELAADVALADVEARLGSALPQLEMRSMHGRFGAKKETTFEFVDVDGKPNVAYEAFARQLALVTKDGVALAPADFTARWEPPQDRSAGRGEVVAKSIELAPLAHLAEFVPIPDAFRHALLTIAPEGSLSDLRFDWTGEIEAPATYAGRGRFADLGMLPYRDAPGFNRLAGTFDFSDKGGRITLAGDKLTVDYPRVLIEHSVAVDTLGARVNWSVSHDGIEVRFDDVTFANADVAGTLSGVYHSGGKGVDIVARATRAEGKHVYKYVPKIGPALTAWLQRAVLAGTSSDVRFRLRGNLDDFPFDDPKTGEFKITAHVTGGALDYAEGWPSLANIAGDLLFDGRKLRITSPRANAFGTQLSNVVVAMPDLFGGHPELLVDGQARGPLGEFLKYIAQSPVRGFLDGFTDRWAGDGPSDLTLHLELPIEDLGRAQIAGTFQFANDTLDMGPGEPPLARVNGRVEFTQSSVSARNLTAQTLGGSVNVQLATRTADGAEGAIVSSVQGTVDSALLAKALELPIANQLRGPIQFRLSTSRSKGQGSGASVFESQLAGVAIDLPAPFAKQAAESWPLKIERRTLPAEGAPAGTRRAAISASLGAILNAQAQVRSDGVRTTVERAAIGIGDVGTQLAERPGIFITGNLEALDLDHLLPALTAANEKSGAIDFAVNGFDLRIGALTVGRRRFHDVALRAQFNALKLWNANVTARELAGEFSWEPEGKGALAAHLKYLIHPERAPDAAPDEDATRELPALAIIADSYTFNGRDLGRLEVQAVNLRRSWRLDRLELAAPEGTLVANGRWRPQAAPERSELVVKADVKDIGTYLARFGYGDTVAKGTATLEGTVEWNGPVYRIDYASLAGDLTVKAEKGQFVKVRPGVGKLLGVLSLQALPRRISLDFRDVFSEGFAFDSITGSAKIAQGIATTDNLAMAGPAASVAITGQADLANETQDLTVRVVPVVGDSIAVAAGFALLNPIIGAGALLAQRLLKDPVGQMFSYEYQVNGSWEDPKVIKVRSPQVPLEAEPDGAKPATGTAPAATPTPK